MYICQDYCIYNLQLVHILGESYVVCEDVFLR